MKQIQASRNKLINVFAAILGDGFVVTWGYDISGGDSGAVLLVPGTAATATTSTTIWNSATAGAFDDAQNGGLRHCRLFMPNDFSFNNPVL